jgi:hypothetical protein
MLGRVFRAQEEGEYVSNHQGGESGGEEHHIESGVLYQPLGGEAASEGSTAGSITPLCEAVAEGPCARSVPDDKTKNENSKCNEMGQDCGRRRSRHSLNEGLKNACDVAGVGISIVSIANIPSDIVRGILGGGGASVTALCREIG